MRTSYSVRDQSEILFELTTTILLCRSKTTIRLSLARKQHKYSVPLTESLIMAPDAMIGYWRDFSGEKMTVLSLPHIQILQALLRTQKKKEE